MKPFLLILLALAGAALLLFFVLGIWSRTGAAPGLQKDQLAPCPDRPNCVSSEANDPAHAIQSLVIAGVPEAAVTERLKVVLREMGGQIQIERPGYLAATFSSALFGFVDDFELRIDRQGQQIHIRAASRVGYSDGGVNRRRVALFRERLYAALSSDE